MKNVLRSLISSFVFTIIFQPTLVWSMGASPGGEGGQSPGSSLGLFAPMILVFLIFYLLLIRPQAKQQKRHREMVSKVQRGDEVVSSSGIHGKITAVTDDLVTLEISENVRVKMDKKQVALVKTQQIETKKK